MLNFKVKMVHILNNQIKLYLLSDPFRSFSTPSFCENTVKYAFLKFVNTLGTWDHHKIYNKRASFIPNRLIKNLFTITFLMKLNYTQHLMKKIRIVIAYGKAHLKNPSLLLIL